HTLPACAARESPGGSLALQEDGGRLGLECERRSEDTLDRDLRALSRPSAFFAHDDQRTRPVINLVGSGPENADRACDIAGDPDRLSVKLPRVVEKCLDRCGTLATRKHHEGGRDQDSWGERTDRVSRWLHTSSSGRRAADHFFCRGIISEWAYRNLFRICRFCPVVRRRPRCPSRDRQGGRGLAGLAVMNVPSGCYFDSCSSYSLPGPGWHAR